MHLIRNALGGGHEEMVRGTLAFSSPMSRDMRDDTVKNAPKGRSPFSRTDCLSVDCNKQTV